MNTTAITIRTSKFLNDYAMNDITKKKINKKKLKPAQGVISRQPVYIEKYENISIILFGYPKLYTKRFELFFLYFLMKIDQKKSEDGKYSFLDAEEYNNYRHLNSVYEAQREMMDGIATLRCTELSYVKGDRELQTPIITDRDIDHRLGKITVKIHDSFVTNLLFIKGSFSFPFPISAFSADLIHYPYIPTLSIKLVQYYKQNILSKKGFISVSCLLKCIGGKPDESNPQKHRAEQAAIQMLERTLNALTFGWEEKKESTDNDKSNSSEQKEKYNPQKLKKHSDTKILKFWDYSTNERDANGDRLPLPDNEQSMRLDSKGNVTHTLPYEIAITRYISYELTDEWINNLEEYRKRKKKGEAEKIATKKENDEKENKLQQMTMKERAKIRAEKAEGIRK